MGSIVSRLKEGYYEETLEGMFNLTLFLAVLFFAVAFMAMYQCFVFSSDGLKLDAFIEWPVLTD